MNQRFDLEDRLIDFAILVDDVVESLPNTRFGSYISGQLVRSGCSPAMNYGEAQSAESRNDFIHKMKIILKELRESMVSLKLIKKEVLINQESFYLQKMSAIN